MCQWEKKHQSPTAAAMKESGSLPSLPFPAFLSLSLSCTPLHTSSCSGCWCGVVAVSFFQLLHISLISLSFSSQSLLPFHIPPPAFACLHTRISPSYLCHRFSSSSSSFFFSSVFFFFPFLAVILFSS